MAVSGPCDPIQDNPEVESLFAQAVVDYKERAYRSAQAGFQRILDLPLNQRYSAALLMIGKTYYKLRAYDEAILRAERLFREFPTSTYVDDGHYLLGNCYYRQGRYYEAAEEYLTIIETEGDPRLVERAHSLLKMLIAEGLSSDELSRLSRRHPVLMEAELTQFRVGVISPLTGDFSDAGQEMVRGIELASTLSGLGRVELLLEDSGGDPLRAVKAAQELTGQESVVVIVGPVRSEPTVGAAAVADCEEVVLITPTATETGIAAIGPYIFQINVTPQTQGAAVAEYAIDRLGLRRFAVLAVSDSYGKDLAGGFVSKVEQLGGTILSQEWYYEGTADFSPQLTHIRDAGLAFEQADSLAWEWKLFGLKTSGLIDTTAEDLFPPVDSIDGLFLAAYGEDIALIAPQVAFQKINTQLLGGNSWNSEEVFVGGVRYVEGAIFAADFFAGNRSAQYLQFLDGYRQRYGQSPSKVAALSYDAMKLLLEIFGKGVRSSKEIRDRLAETRNFQGASGTISFLPGERANSHVFFLTIRNGEIVELD
ncbi:MAG: ABC transporter substrate-binding protein [bacterium]